MNLPPGGELIARAPGWVFELGVYELLLLIGGAVILVGSVALSVGSVREDTGGFMLEGPVGRRRWPAPDPPVGRRCRQGLVHRLHRSTPPSIEDEAPDGDT